MGTKRITPSLRHFNHSISDLIQRCPSLEVLKSIHATMIKSNAQEDSFLANQLITAYSLINRANYALRVFDKMTDPNTFTYNAVIGSLVRHSQLFEVLALYVHMSQSNVLPNGYTLTRLLKACSQLTAMEFGKTVHSQVLKLGFGGQLLVQTVLIDFYSSLGNFLESRRVFDEMPARDVISWTAMIQAHARAGDLTSVRKLFDEMPERNTVSWNTVIAAYARSGEVESALSLFKVMPNKSLVSWTTMISCYSQNKYYTDAIETFERMMAAGFIADEVTLVTVISACAHLGAIDIGRELYMYSMLNKFRFDVYIGSAFIDMFAKCGHIERALLIFYKLEERNLFCWNSIIEGLSIHGHGQEAMSMFKKMKEDKMKPNGVTFVSILSACNHAGLLEEGHRVFTSMIRDYSISPELAHYGCMVDLLGRAGHVQEAFDLIRSMPMEPNAVIWGALLSGCKIYGNFVIAEFAVEKLLILDPSNSAPYILIVNMYVEAKKWEKVKAARMAMKERGVQKTAPACSWYEKDNVVHEFAACDASQLSSDLSLLLLTLDGMLKLEEFSPEWTQNCSS